MYSKYIRELSLRRKLRKLRKKLARVVFKPIDIIIRHLSNKVKKRNNKSVTERNLVEIYEYLASTEKEGEENYIYITSGKYHPILDLELSRLIIGDNHSEYISIRRTRGGTKCEELDKLIARLNEDSSLELLKVIGVDDGFTKVNSNETLLTDIDLNIKSTDKELRRARKQEVSKLATEVTIYKVLVKKHY